MGLSSDEFPLLSALGLYAADIRGDGNCLFNALSDQIYGHQGEHLAIRSRVIAYMREHAAYYKQFIDVHPGGGIRRNPKRKNAGAYSSPATYVPPSEADIDRVFESHLQSMAKGGTYGDNMEITAFSSAFDVDVKIYQRDFAYMVTGGGDEADRPVAHIAYHVWEHYSSIRNADGPHTGLPEVTPKVLSPEEEAQQKAKLDQAPHVQPWQIDTLAKSLPFLIDKPAVKRALEATKGNMDAAWERLVDNESEGTSSQPESSSVERDIDSEDDASSGPNKKQDRRLSRASKARHQHHHRHHLGGSSASAAAVAESRHALSNFTTFDESLESSSTANSPHHDSSFPDSSQQSNFTQTTNETSDDDNDDDFLLSDSQSKDQQDLTSSTPSSPATKPPVRLKIHPPKPRSTDSSSSHQHQLSSQTSDSSTRGLGGGGRTAQKQAGPRISARDRKDMKKQAQKAARKERLQQAAAAAGGGPHGKGNSSSSSQADASAAAAAAALRAKGLLGGGETPPVETLRTLYI